MGTMKNCKSNPAAMLMGTITHAARRDGNIIIHVANGTTHIGPALRTEQDGVTVISPISCRGTAGVFGITTSRAGCGANWRSTVLSTRSPRWNCPNGELRHHTDEINAICEEVAAVIEREGYHTSADDLRYYVEQVIDGTAKTSHPCCRTCVPCHAIP